MAPFKVAMTVAVATNDYKFLFIIDRRSGGAVNEGRTARRHHGARVDATLRRL